MKILLLVLSLLLTAHLSVAEETVVRKGWLPGAELEQEIYFSTTQKDYLQKRDVILGRLKKGDFTAAKSTPGEPFMRVETTAVIGIPWPKVDVGTKKGHKQTRQVTVSEDAYFLYTQWKKGQDAQDE